jgi:T-complex protein 1 subunit delta
MLQWIVFVAGTQVHFGAMQGINRAGFNVQKGVVLDMYKMNVVQPLLVLTSAIQSATETLSMMMKIDDLIVVAHS